MYVRGPLIQKAVLIGDLNSVPKLVAILASTESHAISFEGLQGTQDLAGGIVKQLG